MAKLKKSADQKEAAKAARKKISKIPSRSERAAAFRDKFNADMKGRAVLYPASQYVLPFMYKRLPTGLLSLDVELRGGFPSGGISQVKGPKNIGKNWLACQILRQLQFFIGPKMKALVAMTEMRWDRGQAQSTGVQVDLGEFELGKIQEARAAAGHPLLPKEEIARLRHQVGEIDEMHGLGAEDLFEGILGAVESNIYHLILIDSFGHILTAAQQEEDMASKSYGGAAGPIGMFLKKLAGLLTFNDDFGQVRDVCIIGINQIRDNIGNANGGWRTTGGKALEHALFTDVALTPGGRLGGEVPVYTPEGTKKKWMDTGKIVNWQIDKGKAGIHEGGRGSFAWDYSIGNANFYLDTTVVGVQRQVLAVDGAWIGLPTEDGKDFIIRAQGRDNFVQALAQDALQKAQEGKNDESAMNLIRERVFEQEEIFIKYDFE